MAGNGIELSERLNDSLQHFRYVGIHSTSHIAHIPGVEESKCIYIK